jgi:ligand-binding SRPBCC domain-containing protein
MRVFDFQCDQWLPRPVTEVFPFFADAKNLQAITPGWLNFEMLAPGEVEMKAGALIDYRLRVHGVPLRWRTLIREWQPPHRFVDEQLRGPYRQWIHEHTFTAQEGGTLTRDKVLYAVPGGALINALFVRRDVERIFAFRRQKLREFFGRGSDCEPSSPRGAFSR